MLKFRGLGVLNTEAMRLVRCEEGPRKIARRKWFGSVLQRVQVPQRTGNDI